MSELSPAEVAEISWSVADYVRDFLRCPAAFRGMQLRGGGPITQFEGLLSLKSGFPFCLATCNATSALTTLAHALELQGREIIVPPHSWEGTYGPFEAAGATLVWAKPDENGNIDPHSAETLVTKKTAAILSVDWKGVQHQATKMRTLCDKLGLLYLVDSSHLPDADRPTVLPSLPDAQVVSFGPGKPLPLGEGGALLLRNRSIYERAVALSQHPERSLNEDIVRPDDRQFINARIHPLAALLGVQLVQSQNRGGPVLHNTTATVTCKNAPMNFQR